MTVPKFLSLLHALLLPIIVGLAIGAAFVGIIFLVTQ